MYISKLTLSNFRNYEEAVFDFHKGVTLIIGENGAGKTNILEAIAFLSALRSHRTNQDSDMIAFDAPYCAVLGEFETAEGKEYLNLLLERDGAKRIKHNHRVVKRAADVVGRLNTVVFSPDEMDIVKESPDKRRRYLDIAISKIDRKYFYSLQLYKKIIRQKNRHLKHFESGDAGKVLDIYNEQLAEAGSYIAYRRRFFVDGLNQIVGEIHKRLTGQTSDIYIDYVCHVETLDQDLEQIHQAYSAMLEELKDSEIERRTSLKGCHLDDIVFYVKGRNARKFSSQGQQRILLLSVLFAQSEIALAETGDPPVILLDDILSELDDRRKQLVFEYIQKYQTFITAAGSAEPFKKYLRQFEILTIPAK